MSSTGGRYLQSQLIVRYSFTILLITLHKFCFPISFVLVFKLTSMFDRTIDDDLFYVAAISVQY